VPKRLIDFKPGNSLPSEFKEFLEKTFDRREIERLERLGGRISILLAAPYTDRPRQGEKLVMDQSFLEKLKAETNNAPKLHELLASLSVAQLKQLCRLLKEPIRSRANKGEIASDLIRNLQAEGFWQRISSAS
jgi:hypothetical protein